MTAELLDDVHDVTLPMPLSRSWTAADLDNLPERDGHRYEILYGSLIVSASATPWHQVVTRRLDERLAAAVPDGTMVVDDVDVDFGESVLRPDLLVVRTSAVTPEANRFRPADVLLAVEVESPASRLMDRRAKPAVYAAAGIPAYWRVVLADPEAPAVVVSVLDGVAYREVVTVTAGEAVTVEAPFAVELRPAELVVQGRGN